MKVTALETRDLLIKNCYNTEHENDVEKLTLEVPENYNNFNKKIVFITADGVFWDVIENNEYYITKAISKYKEVKFYIWLTHENEDFRSKTKSITFFENVDASDEITPEEISGVNTVVNILDEEIQKVDNLNITATKVGTTTTITITNKNDTTTSVQIKDGEKGETGENGEDGYTPIKGVDYWTQQDKNEIVSEATTATTEALQTSLNAKVNKTSFVYNSETETLTITI